MTSVNVTTTKNTVTVNGETRVVTVKTRGPQGPSLPDGDKGDVTVSSNGTAISINSSAVTSAKIADGAIVDADINASAAIALTKLATGALPTAITVTSANISDLSIVDADISASAAISLSKLATGALPTAITVTSANISDLSIVNADINASAAIAGTKISPDFGSQNIVTTGTAATGALGVTGNLTVSGTVDGRDLSVDGAKLDGIESGATADQTKSDIDALGIAASTATTLATARTIAGTSFDGSANIDISYTNLTNKLSVGDGGLTQNNFTDALKTKLDGVETGATADQTASEIKTAYESNSDTNAFTDADHTKLDGIEASATADQTAAEIKTLLDSNGIVNSNVDASAAIDGSKISPSFTSNIFTTGQQLQFSNNAGGRIKFSDANNNPDYMIRSSQGKLQIDQNDDSTPIFKINTDGHVDINNNLDCGAGVDVTGNITVTGTVDGVDIAALNTTVGNLSLSGSVLADGTTATTQSASDNSTKVATTAYADTAVANLVDSAPGTLNTLNELAAALGDDPNFATTVTNSIATKLPLAGGTLTGNLTISNTSPKIFLTDTDNNNDFSIENANGLFKIVDQTNSNELLSTNGTVIASKVNHDFSAGIDVAGNITVTGTVDGRDVATDGTKLDGIEASATADQTASEIVALVADQTIAPSTIDMEDNEAILLGTGDDLQIYHNGSNSYVQDSGTGNLIIAGSAVNILNAAANESMIRCTENGSVELRFDDSKKLETTSTGAKITGTGTNTVEINGTGGHELYSYHDSGGVGWATGASTNYGELLYLNESGSKIHLYAGGVERLKVDSSGASVTGNIAVSGTVDGVDVAALNTTVSGKLSNIVEDTSPQLGGNLDVNTKNILFGDSASASDDRLVVGTGGDLHVYHDGTDTYVSNATGDLRLFSVGGSADDVLIRAQDDIQLQPNNGEAGIKVIGDGAVELYHDNSKKFETTSDGIQVDGTATNLTIRSGTASGTAGGLINFKNVDGNGNPRDVVRIKGFSDGNGGYGQLTLQTAFNNTLYDRLIIKNDGNVQIRNDSGKLQLGASQDLEIYHDGSNSYIDDLTGTGALKIRTNQLLLQNNSGDEIYLNANTNAQVELYYDNSKKFETISDGAKVTGRLQVTNYLEFDDSVEAYWGNSHDLQIYHDGTASRIYNTTGNLSFRSSSYYFNNSAGTENCLDIVQNGAVSLYYDNSKKFETTANGVNIESGSPNFQVLASTDGENALLTLIGKTGSGGIGQVAIARIEAESKQSSNGASAMHLKTRKTNNTVTTAITIDENQDINFPIDNQKLKLGASADLQIYHDGSNSYLDNSTGALYIRGGTNSIQLRPKNDEWAVVASANGAVELAYDGSKKFETTSSGINVTGSLGIGTTSPDTPVHIFANDAQLLTVQRDGNNNANIRFRNQTSSMFCGLTSGATGFAIDDDDNLLSDPMFFVSRSSGNVGIGTASPSAKLDVNGDATINSINIGKGANSVAGNTVLGESALDASVSGGNNTAIGNNALSANTSGNSNSAFGQNALTANTDGGLNTGIGQRALMSNTTGSRNTAVGRVALENNTTGSDNTAVGKDALEANTTASDNTAIGFHALTANTTGTQNVAVGANALDANTTASNNTAVGYEALTANTTGDGHVSLGRYSLRANTTGVNNVAVGFNCLKTNTTASNNTAVGNEALTANTTGTPNVGIGYNALGANTTGASNVAVGANALQANTTAEQNTALGKSSLQANTTGENNVACGKDALYANSTGSTNVAVGRSALAQNTTASNNTAVGDNALNANTTGSHNTAVGRNALSATTTALYNVAVGSNALDANTTASYNIAIGYNSLTNNTTGEQNTAIGAETLDSNTEGDNNVGVGLQALYDNTTGGNNTAIGKRALFANTTASNNTALGSEALRLNTTGQNNTAVGIEALDANTTASNNTAIGSAALGVNTTGASNVAVGSLALDANTTASGNTAVGYASLTDNTTGGDNVAIGDVALQANTTGAQNTAVGEGALNQNTTAHNNTAVGRRALFLNTTGVDNTAVGAQALDSNTTGTDNTALGREALSTSTTGAQNTGIGRSSLKNLTTGSFNTGIGYHSLFSQTTGAHNCGLGRTTLNLNTSGGYNTAVGNAALASNTTASNNVAVGYQALTGNTTGTENVAVGANALDSSTTAGYNTAVGYGAMKDCTTGSINVAIGREAMENLTTGAKNVGVGRGALAGTLTGDENVGVGDSAGAAMTSGVSNVAIGAEALKANTTGANNTAVGKSALQVNTTGANNVAVGAYSLDALTTADKNTALGYQSLTANTTGANNTALGALALDANTTASNSVAIGYLALTENTTGTQNIAIGVETMDANTTGSFNVAVGKAALGANTTADYNVAIGQNCLAANTTGTQNVALGSFALDANTTGHSNVGVGKDAGSSVTTGIQNTLIGTDAGAEITAGYYNTCVGNNSGQDITNGYHNVAIGHSTDTNNVDRSITIGTDLTSKGSDYITFGRDSVGVVYNQYNQNASWTRDSDERLKKDINTNTDCGLEFINDLRTVTYKWKAPSEIDSSMPNYDKDNSTPSYDKKMYGFIAQEVKAALDKHNITDFGGWTCPDDGIQGISYEMFVMPLVKAVQELSAKVKALEAG